MMKKGFLFLSIGLLAASTYAQNPIVQTHYTADPAPMAYDGTLYLYTSHDEDASTWFVMNDWKLYTTTDMVNWTDVMPGPCSAWNVMESFMLTCP